MSISGISNSTYTYPIYTSLASGKRINSAVDDPAGLAIGKKLQTQATIYDVTNNNIADSKNLLSVTEGGLNSVTENLQRMRELALQASNGTYSDTEKASIQREIDQLKEQIDSTGMGAQFNGISVLNGSRMYLNGAGSNALSFDSTTESLGIEGFDVTGNFDIKTIDNALEQVNSMRGTIGATQNAMDYNSNANSIASINLTDAQSRIEDTDIAKMAMEFRKTQLFQQVRLMSQKQTQQILKSNVSSLLSMFG